MSVSAVVAANEALQCRTGSVKCIIGRFIIRTQSHALQPGIVSSLAPVSSNRERCNLHAIIAEIGRVFRATLPLLRVFANGRKARGMVGREDGRDD